MHLANEMYTATVLSHELFHKKILVASRYQSKKFTLKIVQNYISKNIKSLRKLIQYLLIYITISFCSIILYKILKDFRISLNLKPFMEIARNFVKSKTP